MVLSCVKYGKDQKLKVLWCMRVSYHFSVEFLEEMSDCFGTVNRFRPKATRKESSEFFIIAKDFKHTDGLS